MAIFLNGYFAAALIFSEQFAAEQIDLLGLPLEEGKEPVDVMVIDHVEHATPN